MIYPPDNTDASILVYKYCPERTGFNMYAENAQLQLTFLALLPWFKDASQARRVLVPSQTEIRLKMNCKSVEWGFFR